MMTFTGGDCFHLVSSKLESHKYIVTIQQHPIFVHSGLLEYKSMLRSPE